MVRKIKPIKLNDFEREKLEQIAQEKQLNASEAVREWIRNFKLKVKK